MINLNFINTLREFHKSKPELFNSAIFFITIFIFLIVFWYFIDSETDYEPYVYENSDRELDIENKELDITWVSSPMPSKIRTMEIRDGFAYLGTYSGLLILNITDTTNITQAAWLGLPGMTEGIDCSGDLCYLANNRQGLRIINISDPYQPHEVGHFEVGGDVVDVALRGNVAYLLALYNTWEIIHAVDVSQPENPMEVTKHTQWSLQPRLNKIEIKDNLAYVIGYGLTIYDVSKSDQIEEVSKVSLPGFAFDMTFNEEYVYLPSYFDNSENRYRLQAVDIAKPNSPKYVTTIDGTKGAVDISFKDNKAYLAGDKLRIGNISNKIEFKEELSFDDKYYNGTRIFQESHEIEIVDNKLFILDGNFQGIRLFAVFDISNSSRLQFDGVFEINNVFAKGIVKKDNYLFLNDERTNLIKIVNISNPDAPILEGEVETDAWGAELAIYGNYLYLGHRNGLEVFNISNPTKPVLDYSHRDYQLWIEEIVVDKNHIFIENGMPPLSNDVFIFEYNKTSNLTQISQIQVIRYFNEMIIIDDLAFVIDNDFHILDLSNLSQIVEIANFSLSNAEDFSIVDDYAIISEYESIRILDISDPSNPFEIGNTSFEWYDFAGFDSQLEVMDNYAYVATHLGIIAINITNVSNPYTAGYYLMSYDNLFNLPRNLVVDENYIYIADGIRQLTVLKHSNPENDLQDNINSESSSKDSDSFSLSLSSTNAKIIAFSTLLAMTILVHGYHAGGETARYRLWAALAPLTVGQRRRRRSEDPLAHHTRGLIQGYLLAHPGAHYRLLKQKLKLNNGTLAHHLRVLERAGLIYSQPRGRLRCFYSVGEGVAAEGDDQAGTAAAGAVEGTEGVAEWTGNGWEGEAKAGANADMTDRPLPKAQQRILALIGERPGVSQKELAEELGVTGAAVKYHVDALIAAGRLRRERRGMRVAYYPR